MRALRPQLELELVTVGGAAYLSLPPPPPTAKRAGKPESGAAAGLSQRCPQCGRYAAGVEVFAHDSVGEQPQPPPPPPPPSLPQRRLLSRARAHAPTGLCVFMVRGCAYDLHGKTVRPENREQPPVGFRDALSARLRGTR